MIVRVSAGYSTLSQILIETEDQLAKGLINNLINKTTGFSLNGGIGYDLTLVKADNLSFGLTSILNLTYQNLYGKTSTYLLIFELVVEDNISTLKLGLLLEPYVMYTVSPDLSLSLGASLAPSYRLGANYNLSFSIAGTSDSTNYSTNYSINYNILTNDNSFSFSIAPALGVRINLDSNIAIDFKVGYEIELTKLISDNASKLILGDLGITGVNRVNASVNNIFANAGLRIKL